ncbi:DUF4326 domain-containing protein [Nocardia sp. NRRL S-836]|uniref:DUF4326 domain-containing protein n=1 Tax=Nocardia sp. NRRL S-836 TaxID=1519492 RepID=UPI0018D194DF|nr:DUF4326 domain-containing protein [Nocardia sp. NRRL S-836]
MSVSMRRGVHPNLISWTKARGLFVRIDRGTKWGNPFIIGCDGDRPTVIYRYEEHLARNGSLLAALGELAGKALGCWCAPRWCHGDILAGILYAGL